MTVVVERRIYHINDLVGNILDTQLCFESLADPDLGFRMWAGKDTAGYETKFLAKDENARVTQLWLNDETTMGVAGFLKHDVNGLVSGLHDVVESIVVGAATPATGNITFAGAVTQDGSTFTFEGGEGGSTLDAAYRFGEDPPTGITADIGAVSIFIAEDNGALRLTCLEPDYTADIVGIHNDSLGAHGIFFDGDAGLGAGGAREAYAQGHRIWTSEYITMGRETAAGFSAYFSATEETLTNPDNRSVVARLASYSFDEIGDGHEALSYVEARSSGVAEGLASSVVNILGWAGVSINGNYGSVSVLCEDNFSVNPGGHTTFNMTDLQDALSVTFGDEHIEPDYTSASAMLPIDWSAGMHQKVAIDADITSVTFTAAPPGVGRYTLLIEATGDDRSVTGFPASCIWYGSEAPPFSIVEDHFLIVTVEYDKGSTQYHCSVVRNVDDYDPLIGGGSLDDAYRFDLPDSKSVSVDNGAASWVVPLLGTTSASAFSNLATANTSAVVSILNDCAWDTGVEPYGIYFSGDAGEGYDSLGHRIWTDDSLSIGRNTGTGTDIRRSYFSLQENFENSMPSTVALMRSESYTDYAQYAWLRVASGDYEALGPRIDGDTTGFIDLHAELFARIQADGVMYLDAQYISCGDTSIRAVQQMTCAAECDNESSSSGILNIDLSSGSPNRLITMTEDITRVNLTKPVGQGRFILYFETDGEGPWDLDAQFRDVGLNAEFLTWYNIIDGIPFATVSDNGSVMIEINYYKNNPVAASALFYHWETPS